jgi:hypothetical protein
LIRSCLMLAKVWVSCVSLRMCLVYGVTPCIMRWCIVSLSHEFCRNSSFLMHILIIYVEWGGDRSTHSIPQTKYKKWGMKRWWTTLFLEPNTPLMIWYVQVWM